MKQLVDLIGEKIPQFATWITGGFFILFLVLQISDDFDKIFAFLKRLFNIRNHIDSLIYSKKRRKYNKVLASDAYLKWQKAVLQYIYGDLVAEKREELMKKNGEGKVELGFTKLDFETGKCFDYESITLKLPPIDFPFSGICTKELLKTAKNPEQSGSLDIISRYKRQVKSYDRLIKRTIRYPKRVGYMLDDILIDDCADFSNHSAQENEWKISAHVGNYENNLRTSHILEYELYQLYKSRKIDWMEIKKEGFDKDILQYLPIRRYIHEGFKNKINGKECDILTSGRYRESLLGVQVFVMIKNFSDSYDALRIRRSIDVSAKPGFLQFIPSGGFEAMNDCTDFDSQWDNYSLCKVVFRELLEECFGQDEDDKKETGNNISPDRIYHNVYIRKILEELSEDCDNQRIKFKLLGITMSLVSLRHELSFVMCIEDSDFGSYLIGNYESKSAIHLVDIKNLEQYEFWHRKEHGGEDVFDDLSLLNCTSAGLFELVRKSSIYQEKLGKS